MYSHDDLAMAFWVGQALLGDNAALAQVRSRPNRAISVYVNLGGEEVDARSALDLPSWAGSMPLLNPDPTPEPIS